MSIGAIIEREFDELGACERAADMVSFVGWLIDNDETGGLSSRDLQSLHWEYCLLCNVRPLSPAKQALAYKAAGIRKSRPRRNARATNGSRPMVYHIDRTVIDLHRRKQQRMAA